MAYDPFDGSIMNDGNQDWTLSTDGVYNNSNNGPDEAFALGVDLMPGQVYVAGRVWVSDFDYGTVRFIRETGVLDPGNADHLFPQFIFDGSAGDDDAVNALHVNLRESGAFRHPDVLITGFTENSGEGTDIRTIKYHDDDFD